MLCAYFGAEAAKVLLVFPANHQRILRWVTWSILTVSCKVTHFFSVQKYKGSAYLSQGLSGGILCSFKIDDGPIPINKNLWSLSFVLVTSSIAFLLLTALYVFIDVLSWWSGAPFRYAGN